MSTGEVHLFLHIRAEPQSVYHSVNVPRHDFDEDVESQLNARPYRKYLLSSSDYCQMSR